mgnify:CR=1 FL=1
MRSNNPIVVRSATVEDVDLLHRFSIDLATYEDEPHAVTSTPETLARDGFGADPQFAALIAERGGHPVGFVLYTFNYSVWTAARGIFIEDIWVVPGERRGECGFQRIVAARRLMVRAEQRAGACRACEFHAAVVGAVAPALLARVFLGRVGAVGHQNVDALDRPLDKAVATIDTGPLDVAPKSNTTPAEYRAMVLKAKEYILAGDIFQVVLSQRFEAPFKLPPFSLYRALRRVNPAPFLYFLDFGGYAVAGSSPEILVRMRDDTVTIRPIAGTRPRGATPHEDKAMEDELLADPKERAEHLMLLDLGRNDVGRVATIGTVNVTDQFFVERYSHVMHIVSNVEGKLSNEHDALDALVAGFPAGTVSGAPKVRAMEIIDELEKEKRGLYAGCVGYFSAAGEMDSCIVLRTALVKDGTMYVQAGAGIVADSDPAAEQTECVNKAKALFRAAEEARRFASAAGRGK